MRVGLVEQTRGQRHHAGEAFGDHEVEPMMLEAVGKACRSRIQVAGPIGQPEQRNGAEDGKETPMCAGTRIEVVVERGERRVVEQIQATVDVPEAGGHTELGPLAETRPHRLRHEPRRLGGVMASPLGITQHEVGARQPPMRERYPRRIDGLEHGQIGQRRLQVGLEVARGDHVGPGDGAATQRLGADVTDAGRQLGALRGDRTSPVDVAPEEQPKAQP